MMTECLVGGLDFGSALGKIGKYASPKCLPTTNEGVSRVAARLLMDPAP